MILGFSFNYPNYSESENDIGMSLGYRDIESIIAGIDINYYQKLRNIILMLDN